MDERNLVTDLFGDVVVMPSGRRGRPAHCWTKSNEDKVILGLALDYSVAEIAFGLGITEPTLRKYYFSALKRREMQKTRFELWQASTLAELANDGNVAALKELDKIKRRRELEKLAARKAQAHPDNPIGKKEAAQRRASEVATSSGRIPQYDMLN